MDMKSETEKPRSLHLFNRFAEEQRDHRAVSRREAHFTVACRGDAKTPP